VAKSNATSNFDFRNQISAHSSFKFQKRRPAFSQNSYPL
jgi:hypothetical protein